MASESNTDSAAGVGIHSIDFDIETQIDSDSEYGYDSESAHSPSGRNSNQGLLTHFVPDDFDRLIAFLLPFLHQWYHAGRGKEMFKGSLKYYFIASGSRELRNIGDYSHPRLLESEAPPFQDLQLPGDFSAMLDGESSSGSSSSRQSTAPIVRRSPSPSSYHHQNFNLEPIVQKSLTPASVSMWFALHTAKVSRRLHPTGYHSVLLSQAVKWIDPFAYIGPNINFKHLEGSDLEVALRPYVHTVYEPKGTWQNEHWGSDRPLSGDDVDYFDCKTHLHLPSAFKVHDRDIRIREIFINDDGRHHEPCLSSKAKKRAHMRSKLRFELREPVDIMRLFVGLKVADDSRVLERVGQEQQPGPVGVPGEEWHGIVRTVEAQQKEKQATEEAEEGE